MREWRRQWWAGRYQKKLSQWILMLIYWSWRPTQSLHVIGPARCRVLLMNLFCCSPNSWSAAGVVCDCVFCTKPFRVFYGAIRSVNVEPIYNRARASTAMCAFWKPVLGDSRRPAAFRYPAGRSVYGATRFLFHRSRSLKPGQSFSFAFLWSRLIDHWFKLVLNSFSLENS